MRYLILLFTLLLTVTPIYFAQWSNDPNNHLIVGYGEDPHICSDSAGGCYITYNNDISYPRKLILERINKYGYKSWNTYKEITGELPEQWQAEIIEDGEGGVIVGYEDNEWIPPFLKTRVRLQKIDSTGNFLWGANGTQVANSDTTQGSVSIISDGDGGCVSAWVMYDEEYFLEYWVNRIDKDGNRVWGDSGKYLMTDYNYDKPRLTKATDGSFYLEIREFIYKIKLNGEIVRRDSGLTFRNILPVPDGGIVVHGYQNWSLNGYTLVAQRKDSLGNNLWQEPYVEIADSLDINTILNIKYNNGYIYYSWTGKKNGVDKVAQFQALRLDGTKLFGEGSIQIGNTPLGTPGLTPSESGNIIIVWNNDDNLPDTTFTQLYDTLGNKLWKNSGIVMGHPAIASREYVIDGNGGFIIGGTINEFAIVIQQVSRNGNLGEIISAVYQEFEPILPSKNNLYQNYPNPFNPSTNIFYSISKPSFVSLKVYDLLGKEIATLISEDKPIGNYVVNFNETELTSGVYIYKIQAGDFVSSKKMILLK